MFGFSFLGFRIYGARERLGFEVEVAYSRILPSSLHLGRQSLEPELGPNSGS